MRALRLALFGSVVLLSVGMSSGVQAQDAAAMNFVINSVGPGKGCDLGGLSGADEHCQSLAGAVGAGNHTWRAYLSLTATANSAPVHARERIGSGPWQNAKGIVIAKDIEELHRANN